MKVPAVRYPPSSPARVRLRTRVQSQVSSTGSSRTAGSRLASSSRGSSSRRTLDSRASSHQLGWQGETNEMVVETGFDQ